MEAFERLGIWRRSSQLSIDLYRSLADCRQYRFKDQVCRAALSVPSNIAEGYERNSHKEYLRFLKIAKGSCGELRTQLYIGIRADILSGAQYKAFYSEAVEIAKMLQGAITSIESSSGS